jgi:PAS domain S-box-containing protein
MDAKRARTHESDLFFFSSPDLLCIVDFDGRFVQVNPAWENVLGVSSAELCSRPYIEFVHPDDREHTAAAAERLIRDSATHTFENRYQLKDGSYKWLQWTCASLPERRRIFGTARDVTELRQLREDLRVANETLEQRVRERRQARHTNDVLKSLIDACPHAIVAVDSQRNVRIWNAAATKIFGWTAEEVLGGRVPFVSDQKREDSKRFNERALRGESITNYATQRSRRDGSQIDLLVSAAPTRDIDGNIDGFLTVATDITDRNKLELQLLRVQRLESLGTLASGIAHDLNNVLAPIGMALQLFRMRFPDASTRNTLDVLDGCVDRGAGLIRQILTFARGVQNEHFPVQTTPLLLDAERVLIQTFPKSITIRSELPQDLWMVSADSTQLHQVLMNLCINARDAMQEGGTLTITAHNAVLDETYVRMNPERSPGPYVVIEVQDTGHGMPADIQEKIFEPFFTTKPTGSGTGLGLSMSYEIVVQQHKGQLRVESEPGQYAEFIVTLPKTAS